MSSEFFREVFADYRKLLDVILSVIGDNSLNKNNKINIINEVVSNDIVQRLSNQLKRSSKKIKLISFLVKKKMIKCIYNMLNFNAKLRGKNEDKYNSSCV